VSPFPCAVRFRKNMVEEVAVKAAVRAEEEAVPSVVSDVEATGKENDSHDVKDGEDEEQPDPVEVVRDWAESLKSPDNLEKFSPSLDINKPSSLHGLGKSICVGGEGKRQPGLVLTSSRFCNRLAACYGTIEICWTLWTPDGLVFCGSSYDL
jgi:hypothetical protein